MDITEDRFVDARDLMRPLPVMAATKAMRRPEPGRMVRVPATGGGALGAVPARAEASDELPESGETAGARCFNLRKCGDA